MFAYNVQDEVEARAMRSRLPEWAQHEKITIVARSAQDAPTMEQLREMMRNLLEDRFALKTHHEMHTGAVNTLVIAKPGITGPGLKQHDPSQVCIQKGSKPPEDSSPDATRSTVFCGLDLKTRPGGIFQVRMIDVTLPEACTLLGGLGGVLGGRGMDTVTNSTGLTGKWDISFEFLPERDGPAGDNPSGGDISGPSFTSALEKQLGLHLKKGSGEIEDLIVDHIARPTPD
jgi:uncharacterized protein (TIGR03435 family)